MIEEIFITKSPTTFLDLEVSDTVINNAFTAFVKNNLMIKECRGQYLLNPKYFFRGTLSNRSKLKLQIEN